MVYLKKICGKYFDDILLHDKRFEIRTDENYQIGDCVVLNRVDTEGNPTNDYVVTEITYVLRNVPAYGLRPGHCIFGFELIVSSKL